MRAIVVGLALVVSIPASAQSHVDSVRLVAARQLVELSFPVSQRDAFMQAMTKQATDTLKSAFPAEMKGVFNDNPEVQAALQRFIVLEQERCLAVSKENLPMMMEAMARAYARRLSKAQLADINGFLRTSSGQAYVSQSLTMMSDPDVQAAQRTTMMQSIEGMQGRIVAFVAEVKRIKSGKQ